MIRRTALIFLEFLAGLAAGAMILMLVAWWWLSSGPVTLTFLNPYIEEALSPRDSTIAVEIDNTVLVWAGWERAVDLRVSNLRVLDLDRKVIAVLPQVSLGFSLRAMMHGMLAPTYLEIIGPRVSVVRDADGHFAASLANTKAAEDSASKDVVLQGLVNELLSKPDPTRPLGYLRRVGIVNADLTLTDHMLNRVWHAPQADITMVRNTAGISADLSLQLSQDGGSSHIAGTAEFRAKTGAIQATLDFSSLAIAPFLKAVDLPPVQRIAAAMRRADGTVDVNASADGTVRSTHFDVTSGVGHFAGSVALDAEAYGYGASVVFDGLQWQVLDEVFPQIGTWAEGALSLKGKVDVAGTMDGDVRSARFDVSSGPGTMRIGKLLPDPVEVTGIQLRGNAEDDLGRIDITKAAIDLPKGNVTMDATATRLGDDWSVRYSARANGIPTNDVKNYWPPASAKSARKWVLLNLHKGTVTEANLSFVARVSPAKDDAVTVESLHGGMSVDGLDVDYLYPLPKVTDARADMTFTADHFDIAIHGGRLRDMSVDSGTVVISGVTDPDTKIAIDLTVRGPLQTALTVLDSKPLGFLGNIGLDAKKISGTTAVRLVFQFPLVNSLRVDQIAVAAGATLRNVAVRDGPLGLSLTDGAMEMKVTGQGLTTTGNADLNGVPVKIDWQENFGRVGNFKRRVSVSGQLSNQDRHALNLPNLPFLDGSVAANVQYVMADDGHREINVQADLKRAVLDFPFVYWRKPSGVAGSLSAFATVQPDGKAVIQELKVAAADLQANARAELVPDSLKLRLLEFRDLKFADNHLMGRIRFRDDGGYDVSLAGQRLDVGPFLQPNDEVDSTSVIASAPIHIDANMDEIILAEGQVLHHVKAVLAGDGTDWRQLDVQAQVQGGAALTVGYDPQGDGTTLRIATDNAGDALKALGWTKRVSGGKLLITGTRAKPDAPLVGKFSMKEFKVSDAPALARILQVLSLTGIFSALNQSGLDFVRLDGKFRYYGGVVEVNDTRAFGSSIGITTEGIIVTDSNLVKLTGTVVPAYTINQVLGKIPILGQILTGGKNEGLFAANYSLSGSLENPQVSVNPLSALAPGFLRNLVGVDVKPLDEKDVPRNTE